MTTVEKFREIQAEGLRLFEAKNRDYGDSFREDGVLGVMIRMKDKLNRFISLARSEGEGAVKSETLRDTLLDLHNYAAMAIITHEDGEGWGPEEPRLEISIPLKMTRRFTREERLALLRMVQLLRELLNREQIMNGNGLEEE